MECRQCATPLDRPGDYCLVCHTANTDTVILELQRERATVTALFDETIQGQRIVTTTPEPNAEQERSEIRYFAGQLADDVRRKRPEEVYATGERAVLREVRAQLRYPFYRIEAENPVEHVIERHDDQPLEVVEASVAEKLGGSHSTLIGGRDGRNVLEVVAAHPNVKKIIPGPIDAGGSGSRNGVRGKVTRADGSGNVRLLIRDGSSVQENRIVTTASNRKLGEHVRADINDALENEGFC